MVAFSGLVDSLRLDMAVRLQVSGRLVKPC